MNKCNTYLDTNFSTSLEYIFCFVFVFFFAFLFSCIEVCNSIFSGKSNTASRYYTRIECHIDFNFYFDNSKRKVLT